MGICVRVCGLWRIMGFVVHVYNDALTFVCGECSEAWCANLTRFPSLRLGTLELEKLKEDGSVPIN
jgi:hypothetical protein